jgi:hypothetical protein
MGLKPAILVMIARLPKSVETFKRHERVFICSSHFSVAPIQIRTGVLALKGLRPDPLDDGGTHVLASSKNTKAAIIVSLKPQPPLLRGLMRGFLLFNTRD